MRRLIILLFVISDIFAWLLLVLSLLGVVLFPFVGYIHASMSHRSLTTLGIVGICGVWLIAAAGAYAIAKRNIVGVVLVLAPAAALVVVGQRLFALYYAIAALVVFGLPFLLAFHQAHHPAASGSAA